MLKLFGAILVLVGSSGYGIRLYLDLRDAISHLRHFKWLLDAFSSEIGYRRLSLPECCKAVCGGCEEPFKTILQETSHSYETDGRCEFAVCFRQKAENGLEKCSLSSEEKDLIKGTFEEMAIYDLEMQLSLLESKKRQLDKYLKKRETEIEEKKKVYTGLGVMVGLLLILILI